MRTIPTPKQSPTVTTVSPNRHSGASRNPVQHCVNHPYAKAAPNRHYRIPQPSFRRKPESRPGRIRSRPRPGGPPNRHSGASRNLGRVVNSPSFRHQPEFSATLRTIPTPKQPPTVIPAKAGIYACRPHCRLPQPSFRLAPESRAALREPSLRRSGPQPSFRRKPESRP